MLLKTTRIRRNDKCSRETTSNVLPLRGCYMREKYTNKTNDDKADLER